MIRILKSTENPLIKILLDLFEATEVKILKRRCAESEGLWHVYKEVLVISEEFIFLENVWLY